MREDLHPFPPPHLFYRLAFEALNGFVAATPPASWVMC
jgi:hypothetical protein